ncbi:hypothetical protein M885DRAFT_508370 [Pelagophyceae sp. CCMP2097]|nr:hypothetical protein M885DRAFT_508370 [Pelagophyceae sp. CCMP2097]
MDGAARRALSVVLAHETTPAARDVDTLRSQVAEARAACPALFAVVGDLFSHAIQDGRCDDSHVFFRYAGRSEAGSSGCKAGLCCDERTRSCGAGPHVTPAGWLLFEQFCCNHRGVYGGSYGSIDGGLRDVIDAWPMSEYRAFDKDGNYDETVICLPPAMCYCMRPSSRAEYKTMYHTDGDDDDEAEDPDADPDADLA